MARMIPLWNESAPEKIGKPERYHKAGELRAGSLHVKL
jgi:hypothetical protein